MAPVLSLSEAPQHPHAVARGSFEPYAEGHVPVLPPRFSATPARRPGPEPVAGADTRGYLEEHGFAADEVDALLASGAVAQA